MPGWPASYGKVMEQLILKTVSRHMKDNKIVSGELGFTKGKSCLASLINFYQEMIGQVDVGKAVDIVYLDFSKAFDSVFHKILIKKLVDVWVDWVDSEEWLVHRGLCCHTEGH